MFALWAYFASRILISYEKLQKKSIGTLFNRVNLDTVKGGDRSLNLASSGLPAYSDTSNSDTVRR